MASKLHESLKVPIRGGVKPPPELVLGSSMDSKGLKDGSVTRTSIWRGVKTSTEPALGLSMDSKGYEDASVAVLGPSVDTKGLEDGSVAVLGPSVDTKGLEDGSVAELGPSVDTKGLEDGSVAVLGPSVNTKGLEEGSIARTMRGNGDKEIYVHREEHNINQKVSIYWLRGATYFDFSGQFVFSLKFNLLALMLLYVT